MAHSEEDRDASTLVRLFDRIVLAFPIPIVLAVLTASAFFAYYVKDFKLDASSDSIVLENDQDLRYYNTTRRLFGSDDYVIVTVTPSTDLFSADVLKTLTEMVRAFESMEHVGSVASILNVPLFHSPDVPLILLATGYKTLLMEDCDPQLAKKELTESPLFKDYLISIDGKTTAVQINFKDPDEEYMRLDARRTALRDQQQEDLLTKEERRELKDVEKAFTLRHTEISNERSEDIDQIRGIIADYAGLGELYLGGAPMIIADIISYVERDIVVLGLGVLLFVFLMLLLIFREAKWVILPTLTCLLAVVVMMGYLGYTHWRTTIVTSNFTALLLVITMAMAMHIIVRFRELYAGNPDLSNRALTFKTIRLVAKPCLYTSLTTIVGFGSLLVSRIRPVMDFGLMMAIGLTVAYGLCFVFFPAAMLLFPKGKVPPKKLAELTQSPVTVFARFTERHGRIVTVCSIGLFVLCAIGATRLEVENRFIDYFKTDTPIYEGMTIIDQRLGGTTPLEVVLEGGEKGFWLQKENLARLREVHQWLDSLPETGKVISPDTAIRILERVNRGKPLSTQLLTFVINSIPEEIAASIVSPYITPDFAEVRIAMRVRESSKELRREELMQRIKAYFAKDADQYTYKAHITGIFVLYNNMLQSLFTSQIVTIGTVFFAIWFMFLLLFRSPSLATIAIIPNILPVVLVLGTLGWMGIPLDMMTIMIAAITLGIAVDFAIHYIHRFQAEFPVDRDYKAAMYRCHNSIGRALYYTSLTIVVGFSILTLSNFIPTIYFGLFSGMAIIIALLASVTLLPLLLISWKPLGPGK